MKFQQVLDEVIKASGVPNSRIGVAYSKATNGVFVVAELGSVDYLGEDGVYGSGNQRRADTTVNLTITFPEQEGNPKLYGLVANQAESISANISAFQVTASDLIDLYVSSINFATSDETGQEKIVSAVVSVVATHNV